MTPKIIELLIEDNDDNAGLDGIALVEHPAHEALFEYFAEAEKTCDEGTCNHYVLADEEIPKVIQMFNAYGEPQGLLEKEGFVIAEVRAVNKQDFAVLADPNAPSSQDTPDVRFRYKYVGPRDKKNRTFCAEMMAANRVFRIEDIIRMSNESVNPVGPSGYSLFEYRGSYNCRHKWVQLMYKAEGSIINKATVRKGLLDEDGMPGPDTRTTATIAAGNTPPRTGFAAQGNPDVSALAPYVDQITKPKRKPVLTGEFEIKTLPLFDNKEDAEAMAEIIGCEGCHEHKYGDKILYMPCEEHPDMYADLSDACWPGFEAIGTKMDGGREVPNCVPVKDEMSDDGQYVVGEFESYTDYPELIKKNAQAALDWIEKTGNPNGCMTQVGKVRAQQLAQGKPISIETVKRMKAYITRHKVDLQSSKTYDDDCGLLAMDAWGGVEALPWVERTIEQYEKMFQVENTLDDKDYDIPDVVSGLYASDTFADQNEKDLTFNVFNNEQRLVVGPAMVPDKMIIRRNEITGEIYYVYFTAETIKKLQQKFMMDKLLDKANIEHQRKFLKGVDVVESWIVDDPEKDKQQVFGMSYPKGTWMIIMKVNDDATWQKVKEGELKGFSVQGYFLEKAKFNSNTHQVIDEIKQILKQVK